LDQLTQCHGFIQPARRRFRSRHTLPILRKVR
jgi:hypothetical protein